MVYTFGFIGILQFAVVLAESTYIIVTIVNDTVLRLERKWVFTTSMQMLFGPVL